MVARRPVVAGGVYWPLATDAIWACSRGGTW